ncbi:KRFA protein, partial [Pachyramphus minor]|nr:KRFA protein [Pachyramphus minor]
CSPWCPQAAATGHNEPCVVSCATSRVIIYPPPVVVTFPGPIISTCPQEAVVGSSAALEGGGPAPGTSLRAEILRPEPRAGRSIPDHGPERFRPRRAPRC